MIVWTLLSLAMLIPGSIKLFAASKLFKYRGYSQAGMVTFIIHLLHGIMWTSFGVVFLLGSLFGNIEWNMPPLLSVILCLIFLADRASAAIESLWIAGIIPADTLHKVTPEKKEIG